MDPLLLEAATLHRKGMCCSQILLHFVLQLEPAENPGLIRAMAGLCFGMGQPNCSCGLLGAGGCALAYLTAKGSPDAEGNPRAPLIVSEYAGWFMEHATSRFGSYICSKIVGEGRQAELDKCSSLLLDSYSKVLELCDTYGIDPQSPPEE